MQSADICCHGKGVSIVPTKDGACVLVLDKYAERYIEALLPSFPDARFMPCTDYSALPSILQEHRPGVALTFKVGTGAFPRDALIESGCVRWIHAGGAGIDHLRPWPNRMMVTNSSGIHGDIMAEYILAAIIGFNHNSRRYERQQAHRHWQKYESRTIAGQTLLVIGFGSIGQHAAKLANSVGMNVVGVRSKSDTSAKESVVVGKDQLGWAAAKADHVAICLPLTEETRGMIDETIFAQMKPGVHLINVARGGIVDDDVLLANLDSGHIAGATLDVFGTEPLPKDSRFWEMESVRITPHSSSDIVGWERRVINLFKDNLERWFRNAPLRNVVQSERGY
jgi:phosphoglycerate dehydrogenase-like enzyme